MRVLVTGGAGYLGSISAEWLIGQGHAVTILDSMVKGHRDAVPPKAELIVGEIGDRKLLDRILVKHEIEAILHCGGRALVGESVANPQMYFDENVTGGIVLLDAMVAANLRRLVFSSSAAVYGEPISIPIEERHPLRPVNPYGETKRSFEGALDWYTRAYGIAAVSLRYFNVAGAASGLGEDHRPETHLIPNALSAVLGGPSLNVFGNDYPTPDGTCIRDYIHVCDLAEAHASALALTHELESVHLACNLGSGTGFTVLEVLAAAESVVGREVPHVIGSRRAGDPPSLVASNGKARELLGWEPHRGTLAEMIGSAWEWRRAHPSGYAE